MFGLLETLIGTGLHPQKRSHKSQKLRMARASDLVMNTGASHHLVARIRTAAAAAEQHRCRPDRQTRLEVRSACLCLPRQDIFLN